MQIPKRRHEKLIVRDESPIPMTESGIQQLREKLDRLRASLPKLAGDAKTAADYGDRSENAEYQYAKGRLRGTHRQILALENQLKRVVPIRSGSKTGKIQLGSTVVLEMNGAKKTFEIVGPQETDPSKGRISHQSPLGTALLGRKAGEEISIKTETGEKKYIVLEVK